MGKMCRVVLMFLVVAAVSSELGWCWGEAMANAKEHINSAANWAQEQFSGGLGNKDIIDPTVTDYKAADTASRAKDAVNSAVSDASKYTADKADQVGNMVGDHHDHVKELARSALQGNEAKLEELKDSYDEAVKKVGESYHSAKGSFSEKSKNTFEAAKEMASDTSGNVGAKIRNHLNGGEL